MQEQGSSDSAISENNNNFDVLVGFTSILWYRKHMHHTNWLQGDNEQQFERCCVSGERFVSLE